MDSKYNIKNTKYDSYVFFNPNNKLNEDFQTIIEADNRYITIISKNKTDTYKQMSEFINQLIQSRFLCPGLSDEYVKEVVEDAHFIIAITVSETPILPNGVVFGFAAITIQELSNSMHVDIICSHVGIKNAGDALVRSLEHLSRILFITSIKLIAVPAAISFYEHYGFTVEPSLSSYHMAKQIKTGGEEQRTKQKKTKKVTGQRARKKLPF